MIVSAMSTNQHYTGVITAVKVDRRFGFIAVDGGGDMFFHSGALAPHLPFGEALKGARVEFSVTKDERHGKPKAVDIRPLS